MVVLQGNGDAFEHYYKHSEGYRKRLLSKPEAHFARHVNVVGLLYYEFLGSGSSRGTLNGQPDATYCLV